MTIWRASVHSLTGVRGTEERGCDFRVKKTRIDVYLQLQNNSSSRRVVNNRPWTLQMSEQEGFSERYSPWFHSAWRSRGPYLCHVPGSGYVKVQTSGEYRVMWGCVSYRSSSTKTQCNLVCPDFSKPHNNEDTKTLIFRLGDLVVIQERYLYTYTWWDIWTLVLTHQPVSPGTVFSHVLNHIVNFLEQKLQVNFRVYYILEDVIPIKKTDIGLSVWWKTKR